MAIEALAPPVPAVPPDSHRGYIETALHWLIEKVSEIVYAFFSCFCSDKSPDLAPPEGAPIALPTPPARAPEVPFEQLQPEEQRRRCAEAVRYFEDLGTDFSKMYEAVGRAVGFNKRSLDWFRSYETIGRRAALSDPVLLHRFARNELERHLS